MSLETVFSFCNSLALLGWILLALAPLWKVIPRLITAVIFPLILALVYGFFLFPDLLTAEGNFGSMEGLRQLFDSPGLLLSAWVHYLAFDLFIGSWEVRDSQKLGISHWMVLPCLALTFLLGPLGLLCYLILRLVLRKGVFLGEDCAQAGS